MISLQCGSSSSDGTSDEGQAWPAPGKLNLFLRIVGRRPDGYHLLQTVFQFIDYGDELYFRVRGDGVIRRVHQLEDVAPEQDLTVRAARLLQTAAATRLGADIRLVKRLPLGAGLGGGSSDAASTLVALDRLWRLDLGVERLAELGLRLGADVPVFVHGRAAWAEGVGEQLTPLALKEPWYLLVVPPCRVSTREIFADPELTRNSPPLKISDFHPAAGGHAARGNGPGINGWGVDDWGGNDCEPVVCRRYPAVAEALAWLARFATPRLTGTGACVFGDFPDETAARRVWKQLPAGWRGFVARGLNRSPLYRP
jgi:4-diphosphocytidyl-2-C-methyl-D-erythritol kinase